MTMTTELPVKINLHSDGNKMDVACSALKLNLNEIADFELFGRN